MRFLRNDKFNKCILVISDIHLGAGYMVKGERNYLEDFHYDSELVDFLEYYSTGEYSNREVELIINGDLFDLLAVPFVEYFDDEFWSEKASLDKLEMILKAHPEVMESLNNFISIKKKKIKFIIGNHDAEFIFESLRDRLMKCFDVKRHDKFEIILGENGEYVPEKGIVLKHGHEYEIAHHFSSKENIIENENGEKFFLPPWGSYYVTRVLNKFKEERDYINSVRPIRKFLINGLIYDTLFTLRFMISSFVYFLMVRSIYLFNQSKSFKKMFKFCMDELELFQDFEELTSDYFNENPEVKVLVVGHTHEPVIRSNSNGCTFINTGTWTNMHNLDFGKRSSGKHLTFAQINLDKQNEIIKDIDVALNVWKGTRELPFNEYS